MLLRHAPCIVIALSVACGGRAGDPSGSTTENLCGEREFVSDGYRVSRFRRVICTQVDDTKRQLVGIDLEICEVSLAWGTPDRYEENEVACCDDTELSRAREVFSDEMMGTYADGAVEAEDPSRAIKLTVDEGDGHLYDLWFPEDGGGSEEVTVMLAYCQELFDTYSSD